MLAPLLYAADVDALRSEITQLRKELQAKEAAAPAAIRHADSMARGLDGRNAVTTRSGRLQIAGLMQVWYQAVQNDPHGLVGPAADNNLGAFESFARNDNDTFRIRRAEIRATADVHENISAVLMIDPASETNSDFLPLPTFRLHNSLVQSVASATGSTTNNITPGLLRDAYINVHGLVPHHDFTFGQCIVPAGEEAWRDNGRLEFVERAMVTAMQHVRDIGVMAHGDWFNGRLQYWAGVFNGPDATVLTDPDLIEGGNRTDDNDAKDIAWRLLVRPVWSAEQWYGRLELGCARTDGRRGISGNALNEPEVLPGLNEPKTWINRQAAWIWYRPNGPIKGLWLRGEYGSQRGRLGARTPTQLLGLGSGAEINGLPSQADPRPIRLTGWYAGIGYRMSESIFADSLCSSGLGRHLAKMEFAFRYESADSVVMEDLVKPDTESDIFRTRACTAGVNYYLKGDNAKLQANYIWVDDPSSSNPGRGLREIRNNVFVINLQVMF
jgi:hypothetical protein